MNWLYMIDVEFENPTQVDKLASFAVQRIQSARTRVLYIAFLFTNSNLWSALKRKVLEGIEVSVFAPPIARALINMNSALRSQ